MNQERKEASRTEPRFGPAGNPDAFYASGRKHSHEMPAYLSAMELDAYEYQFGRGVSISREKAGAIREAATRHGVAMSVHAPYYINLASEDPDKRNASVGYVLQSLEAAQWLGAARTILHPGSANHSGGRPGALEAARVLLRRVLDEAGEQGLLDGDAILCPEVMGKINQLGDLAEVVALCRMDDRLVPCVDFGHLNARTRGAMDSEDAFRAACLTVADGLGQDRMRRMHVHFSRIEYSEGGEKKHHTLADRRYGPDFEPFARVLASLRMTPWIICESNGTQAEDARTMKDLYREALRTCREHPSQVHL